MINVNRKFNEDKGTEWFLKAIELIKNKSFDEYDKHINLAQDQYIPEYEIIACIGQLTEKNANINLIKHSLNQEIVHDIKFIDGDLPSFEILTILGNIRIFKISDVLPKLQKTIIENHSERQGLCHEKNFKLALLFPRTVNIVTGNVSILSNINKHLHTWVEDKDSECIFDYTFNLGININTYKELFHCESPILEYLNDDFKSNKLSYDDFVKSIQKLYN